MHARSRARPRIVTAIVLAALMVWGAAAPAHADLYFYDRIGGADRFETSRLISERMPSQSSSTVFLASGVVSPDALAAAPVAAAERAHLLLTDSGTLREPTRARLAALRPTTIVIVGGPTSINGNVEAAVRTTVPTARIERIAGADRVDTSLLLLERMRRTAPVDHVWVVDGWGFADALSASAIAARGRHAIVLAHADAEWWAGRALGRLGPVSTVSIAGGAPSVSTAIEERLRQRQGVTVARFGGVDRYETSAMVNTAFTQTVSGGRVYLASGQKFPDGLAAAQLAAANGSTLYLAPSVCHHHDAVLRDVQRLGATRVVALGSISTLSAGSSMLTPCGQQPPTLPSPTPTPDPAGSQSG
ncbi:cell wall-binding repeat-containing protein [Agrococcus sp. DT81.2]|uniref:cell wall-binding repeat-containing protein n=1 Tax=Agrococcus sp. DT81.2 TaxID=3393414 RepID=UPI003CE4F4E8